MWLGALKMGADRAPIKRFSNEEQSKLATVSLSKTGVITTLTNRGFLIGDYFLPHIAIGDATGLAAPLGRYGRMHKAFLKVHRPILFDQLLLSGQLYPLCREIDEAAAIRLAAILDRAIAHEIILSELVYV